MYGGTKTEMERLLVDAQKLTGIKYDINNFSDVIEAIHAVQTEMGITGTTAKEASETIEGSFNMTKSAWTNLLTGMSDDNADFDVLVQNLVNSLGSLGKNLLPRIKIAIEGIGELIRTLLPKILDEIPEMMASLFPESMQEDIKRIFEGIVEAIKNTVNVALQWLPKITEGFAWILDNGNTIATVIVGIGTALLVLNVANMIMGVVKAFKGVKTATEAWAVAQKLLNIEMMANPIGLIIAAIAGLVAGFIYLWNTNEGFREFWINAWTSIKDFFVNAWNSIIAFFTETIPSWIEGMKTWFGSLGEWFGTLWTNIKQFFIDGWNAISSFFTETIPTWIQQMFDWFNELPYKIGYAMGFVLQKIIQWGTDTWNYLVTNVPKWIENVVKFFSELPGKIWTWLLNTINKIIQWGQQTHSNMVNAVTKAINAVIEWFTKLPGRIWEWLVNTIAKVIQFGRDLGTKAREAGLNMVEKIIGAVKDLPSKFLEIGVNIVKGIWDGIVSMTGWIGEKVTGFFKGLFDGAKKANDIHSPSRLYRDGIGKYIALGIAKGIDDNSDVAVKSITKLSNDVADKSKKIFENFNSNMKKLDDERSSAMRKSAEDLNNDMRKAEETYSKTMDSIMDKQNQLAQNWANTSDIFKSDKDNPLTSVSIIENAKKETQRLKEFSDTLSDLENKGAIPREILDKLRDAGPASLEQLKALNDMDSTQLDEFYQLHMQRLELANSIAEKKFQEEKDQAAKHMEESKSQAEEDFSKAFRSIMDKYDEGYQELQRKTRESMEDIGLDIVDGLVKGINMSKDKAINLAKKLIEDINSMMTQANMGITLTSGYNSDLVSKMKASVDYETAKTSTAMTSGVFGKLTSNNVINNNDNGITQNVTIVNPQRTPSENARALKKVGRDLGFGY